MNTTRATTTTAAAFTIAVIEFTFWGLAVLTPGFSETQLSRGLTALGAAVTMTAVALRMNVERPLTAFARQFPELHRKNHERGKNWTTTHISRIVGAPSESPLTR